MEAVGVTAVPDLGLGGGDSSGAKSGTPQEPPSIYGIRIPSVPTLKRYGLNFEDWLDIVERNITDDTGPELWLCPVCGKTPPSGRTVVDHRHVKGWKKMAPHDRKRFVRGVVCVTCNHFVLTRYGTPEKFRRAAAYLERYDRRAA